LKTKEELLALLEEESKHKFEPKVITSDEYTVLFETSSFKCPIGLKRCCGGKRCPPKPDDIHEDYYEECVQAITARQTIKAILDGKIFVLNNNHGWEMPG